MHQNVPCNSCHVSKIFTEAGTRCADCHADFHKRQFGAQCENCHTVLGWRVNTRPIQDHWNRFPLLGAHVALTCDSCHIGAAVGQYVGLSTQCFSCHAREFQQNGVLDHRAAGFPTTCETCHNADRWQITNFDHTRFAHFALTGSHQNLPCNTCHVGNHFQGVASDCASCHLSDFTKTTNPNHVAAGFPHDCATCHNTATWDGATFNHNLTKFPLTGAHATVTCLQCHTNGNYTNISTDCVSCHLKDYQATTSPNHIAASFPQSCQLCHTTTQWLGATFDHNTTKFPLTGKHATTTCAQCHSSGQYASLSTTCSSCHLKDYQTTNNPNHVAAGFPQDCQLCHNTTQWLGAKFDHNATKFPLTGAHTTVTCSLCHTNGQYATLSTNCVSCHLKDYQGTTSPNHLAASFPQDCQLCHNTTQWLGAKFDHNATKFPLTGAHATINCQLCHSNGQYATLNTACSSCHLKDYQATSNPNHAAAGFPQDCQLCHSTADWTGATFNHTSQTSFPLTGAHTAATCVQCHSSGVYKGLATTCSSCHLKDFQGTTNPNHATAGFPQDCQLCHTTTAWAPSTFNHSATKFPLTGAHTTTTCAQCHASGQYATLPTACNSCHLKDYQGTTNPNHAAAGFPQDCSQCHTTIDWSGAKFDHTAQTTFPLTGKHATTTCTQCHSSGVYKGLSTACNSCHLADYQGTNNPNHAAAGFPQNCQLCHTTTDWTGATFNHTTQTTFPLTGKHTTSSCNQCHSSGVYKGLSTACNSCHLKDYQGTTNPNHAAAGFPQDCSLCHSTTDWLSATFDHSKTKFPLTGKHTTAACAQCHASGQYATLSTACYSCHSNEYNTTTNPNHKTLGYPQDCSTCHSTNDWLSATFNHSTVGFTLVGKHATTQCVSCHVGGKFAGTPTDCYSCHTTEYSTTTNPNHIAAGFPKTCLTCHLPTIIDWTGATFNHTWFPMTHGNANSVCANCHTNSNDYSVFTCTSCHLKTQTDPKHSGVRGYVYNSANCYSCHPAGRSN